jgi:hypothetical protein
MTPGHARPSRSVWGPCVLLGLVVAVCAAWFLYAESAIAGQPGFPLDDSWIYAVFARNIATGHGYAFNAGEHVAGATGPLYAFVLALLYFIFRDVVLPAKLLGIACLAASSMLMYLAARSLDPQSRVKPILVGLLVGISPSLLWSSVSGMEIPLYLLLVSLGIYFYVRKRWTAAAAFWATGVWVRPDGILLALAAVLLGPPRRLRSLAAPLLTVVSILSAFFAFHYLLGGSLFPNSVLVKTHLGRNPVGPVWEMVREWAPLWGLSMRRWDFSTHAILLLPAIVAGALLLRQRFPALGAYALGLPLALGAAGAPAGSHGRYLMPTIPFALLLAVTGLEHVSRRLRWGRPDRVLIMVSVVCLGWQAYNLDRMGRTYGQNVENINHMQRLLAGRLRDTVAPGDTIAVNDVGAIGYFSGCYVVDLVGLVSRPRPFPENLRIYRPKYVVIFPDWYQKYLTMEDGRSVFFDPDSAYHYVPVAGAGLYRNTISSRSQMYVFGRFPRGERGPETVKMSWN